MQWSTSPSESHVDRSILSANDFVATNVHGTATLLDAARASAVGRFLLVSTDKVYGDIEAPLEADETFRYGRAALMQRPKPPPTCWRSRTSGRLGFQS